MTAKDRRARIVLADEQTLLRAALRVALDSHQDLHVVGEAGDDETALREVARLSPDVVLIDAGLPACGGVELCAAIRTQHSDSKVLVLSDVSDPKVLVAALEAGADGYVAKDSRLVDLVEATRSVLRGEACVPPMLLGGLLQELIARRRRTHAVITMFGRLSRREREVLGLLSRGLDHDDIASALFISPQTARTHIQNVMTKLEVHSRLEATALAIEHGLVAGEDAN